MYYGLVMLALFGFTMSLSAGEIKKASVGHYDGMYNLEIHVVLSAPFAAVHSVVTDYNKLARISEVLVEARLLSNPESKVKKRRLVTQTCILLFCFKTKMVEHVWETENTIITRIIPEQSSYKYGKTVWQIKPIDENHTSIKLNSELEPAFWIPPFIGPFLLKQKMVSEATETINRIEKIAING